MVALPADNRERILTAGSSLGSMPGSGPCRLMSASAAAWASGPGWAESSLISASVAGSRLPALICLPDQFLGVVQERRGALRIDLASR